MVLVQRIFSYKHMEHKELPCLFVLLNLFRISFILSGSVPVRRDFKGPTNWQADAFGARQLGRWSTDTITDNPHNKQTDTYTYTKVHTQTICECWVCLMLINKFWPGLKTLNSWQCLDLKLSVKPRSGRGGFLRLFWLGVHRSQFHVTDGECEGGVAAKENINWQLLHLAPTTLAIEKSHLAFENINILENFDLVFDIFFENWKLYW